MTSKLPPSTNQNMLPSADLMLGILILAPIIALSMVAIFDMRDTALYLVLVQSQVE